MCVGGGGYKLKHDNCCNIREKNIFHCHIFFYNSFLTPIIVVKIYKPLDSMTASTQILGNTGIPLPRDSNFTSKLKGLNKIKCSKFKRTMTFGGVQGLYSTPWYQY